MKLSILAPLAALLIAACAPHAEPATSPLGDESYRRHAQDAESCAPENQPELPWCP